MTALRDQVRWGADVLTHLLDARDRGVTSCVWRDADTGERVCLLPNTKHDCPLRATRLANRCTRVDRHACLLGRHLPRASWRPDLSRDPEGQSPVAQLLGAVALLGLLLLSAVKW